MTWPIFIPTKGRAYDLKTARVLAEERLPFTLVVEPQEADLYRSVPGGTVVVLPARDMGLAYSRRFILGLNDGWFWMMDDDVGYFLRRNLETRRAEKCRATEALHSAEVMFEGIENLGQGALEYRQVIWATTKPYMPQSACDVVVAIHGGRVKARGVSYRDDFPCKEDRDFTLQVLSSGLKTARCQSYGFSAPKNGSNRGGLMPEYSSGKEAVGSRALAAAWPGIVREHTKTNGRPDAKIDWKRFR